MKPIPFIIPKTQDSSFHVQVDRAKDFYGRLHQHPEWQITAIHKGQGVLFAGNSSATFQEGDVFILGSNIPHLLKNDHPPVSLHQEAAEVCSISLFFQEHSFGKDFFTLPELKEVKSFLQDSHRGIIFSGTDKQTLHAKISGCVKLKGVQLLIELLSLLDQMKSKKEVSYINNEAYTSIKHGKADLRINQVINYTIQHLQEEIPLSKIADIANLSVSQFCRYFKIHTKKTYVQFLNELRVETACAHLQKNDYSIAQIADTVGFQNLSNFNRQFKKIKRLTPSAFRISFHQTALR